MVLSRPSLSLTQYRLRRLIARSCWREVSTPEHHQLHQLILRAGLRLSSTAPKASKPSSSARSALQRVLAPFDNVSIYNAGTFRTTIAGFSRVATIVLLLFGSLAIAPTFLFDPSLSPWWTPVIVLGSATPMIVTTLAAAPYVSNVRLVLPSYVKRNKLAVESFVRRVPPETSLVLQTMRFVPWPMHREVRFDQLRRLPESKWRGTNLEVVNPNTKSVSLQRESWISRRLYQSYHIDRNQVGDTGAMPGIMDTIWQQIPFAQPLHAVSESRSPIQSPRRSVPATKPSSTRPPPVKDRAVR